MFSIMKRKKKLATFIRTNRRTIDEQIRKTCPNVGSLNDVQRQFWIMNYEPLYRWALSEKVQI